MRHVSPDLDALRAILAESEYELGSLIARGGMADIYRVDHRFLGRSFALKLLHPVIAASPGFIDRFFLEAKILGRLESPHIVEVVDLWIGSGNVPILILELLEGQTIAEKITRTRRLPLLEATQWLSQLLEALAEAHSAGLIHRDIKPENLFLHTISSSAPSSSEPILKVLDFGLARITEQASTTAAFPAIQTTTGAVVGSPSYLSPEGLRGERVDERADLFAAGLVYYEMLLGCGPFEQSTEMLAPRSIRDEIPVSIEAVLRRALAYDPNERFQSAVEFAAALNDLYPSLLSTQ